MSVPVAATAINLRQGSFERASSLTGTLLTIAIVAAVSRSATSLESVLAKLVQVWSKSGLRRSTCRVPLSRKTTCSIGFPQYCLIAGLLYRLGLGHRTSRVDESCASALVGWQVSWSIPKFCPRKAGTVAKRFFDPNSLIPFRHPFGARERANLQLSQAPANSQMDDRNVFGLTRPCREYRAPIGRAGSRNRLECLGEGSCLIRLDQNSIARPCESGFPDPSSAGNQKIVADDLDAISHSSCKADQAGLIEFR